MKLWPSFFGSGRIHKCSQRFLWCGLFFSFFFSVVVFKHTTKFLLKIHRTKVMVRNQNAWPWKKSWDPDLLVLRRLGKGRIFGDNFCFSWCAYKNGKRCYILRVKWQGCEEGTEVSITDVVSFLSQTPCVLNRWVNFLCLGCYLIPGW